MIHTLSLEGRVAIVTGAKRGIGKAIALGFAEAGADVVVCTRDTEGSKLNSVSEAIRSLGRRSLAVKADVSLKDDVENLVQKTVDEFGAIDILVNNAGIIHRKTLLEHSEEDWDRVIGTDLKGSFLCAQAAGRRMIEQQKGNIINISSIRSVKVAPERGAYCIAKAAVSMLTKVLAIELAKYNIRVNSLAPGWVKTRQNEAIRQQPEGLKQILSEIPLGWMAEPSDMVPAALFLASDASGYITGQTIFVEGGQLLV